MAGRSQWQREIRLAGRMLPFTIRRSERAKRMSLRVLPGQGLEVVLPRGVALREAFDLVRREQEWVLRAIDRMVDPPPADLRDGSSLPYLGKALALRVVPGARNRAVREGAALVVTTEDGTPPATVVEAWYRREARRVIGERVALRAEVLGVQVGRIVIKDTRSRWGSCSAKGNLNFSWRLLLAPFDVLDYVVAHEVAHLRELNHSPRFWALVESLCPGYREHRTWLRTHGVRLSVWPASLEGSWDAF